MFLVYAIIVANRSGILFLKYTFVFYAALAVAIMCEIGVLGGLNCKRSKVRACALAMILL